MTDPTDLPLAPDRAVCLGTLRPAGRLATLDDAQIVQALRRPIWRDASDRRAVVDTVRPGEKTCLVVSDHTRRTCTHRVLPLLMRELAAKGVAAGDCFILFASGIHRLPQAAEIRSILGNEVAESFAGRILFHDPDAAAELVSVGVTSRGHRVRVNRRAIEADRLILIGAATYHYHAGFGGGRKSLVPGLAARDTIAYNHSLTLDAQADRIRPGVEIGRLDGNPVAEEMLEGARLCEPDAIVNTVLSSAGELVGVFAGDLDLAHRAACRLVEQVDRVDLGVLADFVIASARHASNWIQSHKALFNASRAVREEGRIVLSAPCPDGIGNERFRYWVTRPAVEDIYRGLRQSPEVLGQTALSTRLRGARTTLITGLSAQDVRDLGIETAPDVAAGVSRALAHLADQGIARPTYYLMPEADSVVPWPPVGSA